MESPERAAAGSPPEGQKKVALLGFAPSWKDAPFDDPSVTIVGLNELHKYVPRWDVWFELHDEDTLGVTKRDLTDGEQKRHLEWLSKDHGKPIFVQDQFCDGRFPSAARYPRDAMIQTYGRYFTSSIGYMLAWAMHPEYGNADWIGLYGIDLASDVEYMHQRPNAEYLIGLARGMGKTVIVPPTSALLKSSYLYGYEKAPSDTGNIKSVMVKHKDGLNQKRDETIATLNTLDGAIQEAENVLKFLEYSERGCQITTF